MTAEQLPNDIQLLKAIIERQRRDIVYLEELIKLFQYKKFASANESMHPGERLLFDEAEVETPEAAEPNRDRKPSPKQSQGRKPLPEVIPRVDKLIDLDDEQKICPTTGRALRRVSEEISERLDIIPAKLQVIRTIRPKYTCDCGQCGFYIAPIPASAIPKSIATAGLLAYIATAKYADALPLYRQEEILQRIGCDLPRSTLSSWMIKCGNLVTPLIDLMRKKMLESPLVQCDETPVQVLKGTGKKPTSKSYMWVQAKWGGIGERIVLYKFDPSRSGEVPLRLFEGYRGYVQTDGYEGYSAVAQKPGITHVGDWVHVRRKFHDVVKAGSSSSKAKLAEKALVFIAELYRIESEIEQLPHFEKLQIRQSQSREIVNSMKLWTDEVSAQVPPKSLIGKALSYFQKQWPKLCYFINDLNVGLDTNAVENAIRPFAIGKKNWLFSDTAKGADASANLYSLIITAKSNQIEPYEYLRLIFEKIPTCESVEDLEALLPWTIVQNQALEAGC